MSDKTIMIIDGWAFPLEDDKVFTDQDHTQLSDALFDAAEKLGFGLAFGSFLVTQKQLEAREKNMETVDYTTGKNPK